MVKLFHNYIFVFFCIVFQKVCQIYGIVASSYVSPDIYFVFFNKPIRSNNVFQLKRQYHKI